MSKTTDKMIELVEFELDDVTVLSEYLHASGISAKSNFRYSIIVEYKENEDE